MSGVMSKFNAADRPEPPIPENEADRLKELQSFNILYTLPEDEFDVLSRLAARVCNMPVCQINFIDTDKQFIKSCIGISAAEDIPRSQSICQYTIMENEVFEVKDLTEDPRFRDRSYVRKEPHYRYYAGAPLISENGFRIGSLCVLDYKANELTNEQKTDLKILADEVMTKLRLRKREKALENMNIFKERLMKVVGHDIRSPLTGIMGAAEFLGEADLTKEEKENLIQIINESAGQIQNIVGELLDSQLVQFGKLNHNPSRYEPKYGIEGVVNLFRFTARNKNISLDYNIESELPSLMIDEQKYERIIANLLSNAIKFTPRNGSVEVFCSYERKNGSPNKLITKVKDNGIGMSDELLDNLFKRKDGGGRSGTENESSYGLGMYIVKKLSEICNAEIDVESEVDEGTTFTVSLPAPVAD